MDIETKIERWVGKKHIETGIPMDVLKAVLRARPNPIDFAKANKVDLLVAQRLIASCANMLRNNAHLNRPKVKKDDDSLKVDPLILNMMKRLKPFAEAFEALDKLSKRPA